VKPELGDTLGKRLYLAVPFLCMSKFTRCIKIHSLYLAAY
jgi:hypothetical protein